MHAAFPDPSNVDMVAMHWTTSAVWRTFWAMFAVSAFGPCSVVHCIADRAVKDYIQQLPGFGQVRPWADCGPAQHRYSRPHGSNSQGPWH